MDLKGTRGVDRLVGGPGDEELRGFAGNDRLEGLGGDDELYGGRGADTLIGGAGDDEMTGGAGQDLFVYTGGFDEIEDLSRGDQIEVAASLGVSSSEAIFALLSPARDDDDDLEVWFGPGNVLRLEDVSLADLSADMFEIVSLDSDPGAETGPSSPVATGGATAGSGQSDARVLDRGREVIGDARDNEIDGTSRSDLLSGKGGDDEIDGGRGRDTLLGGGGDDELDGENGRDLLRGNNGDDELDGGGGNDRLRGDAGDDDLDGGRGRDTLKGGEGDDELDGGRGRDLFVYDGGRDVIEDFQTNETIRITGDLGLVNFAGLQAAARSADGGDDTVIVFNSENRLRLEDVRSGSLQDDWFVFG